MKRWFAAIILASVFETGALWAAKGPEVGLVDDKLSVNAESVSLGRLLQLIDLATGMKSKVPPELANRNVTVKFSGLNVADGVRKLFQGQPLDYVVIEGQGIIVTGSSKAGSGTESAPVFNAQNQPAEQPFVQDFPQQPFPGQPLPGQQLPPQVQPATIPTPFGAMNNPRAGQLPTSQPVNPSPQNSLFPQVGQPLGQPAQQQLPPQTLPGVQTLNPNPFGTPSTFSPTVIPNNQNNNLFAPVFVQPGNQQ